MKPEQARELFSEYADGTLSPALRLALEQYFETEPATRAEYEQFSQVWGLLDSAGSEPVEVPRGFRAKVLELAAAEQARRDATPMHRAAVTMTGWFRVAGRRRVTGGVLATLAVIAVAAVFVRNVTTGTTNGTLIPLVGNPSRVALAPTIIQGVTTAKGQDGNLYHLFQVHLPPTISHATITASVVTDTDQITDLDARAHQAMPALKRPQALTNDEAMQIPVALLHFVPPGTTLNMLVQWTGDTAGQSGTQVVFTPVQTTAVSPPAPVSGSNEDFYDALQSIAAAYRTTIIVDADTAPTRQVATAFPANKPEQALHQLAAQVGYTFQKLPGDANTYHVFPQPAKS